ncbi:MAG: MBL fold metallo-hydrolase [Oscillatoriales cyanobacterium C42_A2020_001]|nr:MBL fold metallo-hydrolase [Leptolyngbyaceae cyanobacterium C42_A2020_001]
MELECLAYGVGHAEEGVCLLLRIGPYRVMLDCGLTDPSSVITPIKQGIPPADLVICSHAHADHARGLLRLHQAFPQLPIYASEVTTQLLPLNWAAIPLDELPLFCHALPLQTPVEFLDGLSAELYPAGHLPGATAILLTYTPPATAEVSRSYTVLYTGDFFLSNTRLVEGLPLEELRGSQPDVLIVEGSYGTSRHPHRRQQENQLAERINRAIADQQSILLPAYLGLGQELLMLLRSHHYFTGRDLDIWVDGSIAKGCDAYLEILPHLPTSVQNFARHQALFWDERVRPRVRRLVPDYRSDIGNSPCIVLTDDTTDLRQYYRSNPRDWLVLCPQEPHRSGTEAANLRLTSPLSPLTETYLLAQHCDGPGTTQLIHNLRPQHVIFVHGSETYLSDLTGLDELHNRYHLHTPSTGSRVELPIGETFIQPAAPETSYEGELTELDAVVTITLPNAIAADPRWRLLADTGLIEARWQGDELILRGLPQRELLRQGSDRLLDWMDANSPLRNCCGNCRHYRGQRCWNPASPLFEFRVTPEGFCPVFESIQTPPEEGSDQEMRR